MRFEDEHYVRVFIRDTDTVRAIGWEGRSVLWELMRKVDRAGIFEIAPTSTLLDAVCRGTGIPRQVCEAGLLRLLREQVIEHYPDHYVLVLPRFLVAQECRQTDRARKQAQRERDRAKIRLSELQSVAQPVTKRDTTLGPEVQPVTKRDTKLTESVTKCDAAQRSEVQPVTKRDIDSSNGALESSVVAENVTFCDKTTRSKNVTLYCTIQREREISARAHALQSPCQDKDCYADPGEEIWLKDYQPTQDLIQEAVASGLSLAQIEAKLEDYREKSVAQRAPASTHERSFRTWLRNLALQKSTNGGKREEAERGAEPRVVAAVGASAPGACERDRGARMHARSDDSIHARALRRSSEEFLLLDSDDDDDS